MDESHEQLDIPLSSQHDTPTTDDFACQVPADHYPYGHIERNWEKYFDGLLETALHESYEALIGNLDELSIKTVDMYLSRLKRIPYRPNEYECRCHHQQLLELTSTEWDREQLAYIRQFDHEAARKRLGVPAGVPYVDSVMIYHNGLTFLEDSYKQYIANNDFIDGGAFLGESVFVFQQYSPRHIYA